MKKIFFHSPLYILVSRASSSREVEGLAHKTMYILQKLAILDMYFIHFILPVLLLCFLEKLTSSCSVPEHPNIIFFYAIAFNYPDLFIVTEFADKGSLLTAFTQKIKSQLSTRAWPGPWRWPRAWNTFTNTTSFIEI